MALHAEDAGGVHLLELEYQGFRDVIVEADSAVAAPGHEERQGLVVVDRVDLAGTFQAVQQFARGGVPLANRALALARDYHVLGLGTELRLPAQARDRVGAGYCVHARGGQEDNLAVGAARREEVAVFVVF